ncbi:MAG: hypothetical protein AB9842_03195 [Bacteroidales bacterium]
MKRKNIIIIILIAVVAVAIIIASRFYPPAKSDDASGTIGKAEKFRKGQFTAEDILLRDDILEDTAVVGKTLDQILAFTSFIQQEKYFIDTFWIKEIQSSCPEYPGCTECVNCARAVTLLQDYSAFLQNHKETIQTTVEVLLAAYNGKQNEYTFDVGVKILGFVQFIDEMVKRDSVLTTAIHLVDQYITKEKITDKKRQATLNRLKQVRDKMVIDNLLFAMKTGDRKQSDMVASIPFVCSADEIRNILSVPTNVESSASTVGSAQVASSGNVVGTAAVLGIPVLAVVYNTTSIGSYGTDRFDAAVYGTAVFLVHEDDRIVRNGPTLCSELGLDNVATIKSLDNAPTIANIIGVGYSNVFVSAVDDFIGSSDGTIFSAEIGNVFEEN